MLLDYMLEYNDKHYHEEDFGFFTWSKEDNVLCVWDIYTKPEYRSQKYAWKLFTKINSVAKKMDCDTIEGYVDKDYKNKEKSLKVLEAAGFTHYNETEECFWLRTKVNG